MSDRERKLWPYKPRTSIVAALLILFGLLLTLVILQVTIKWPGQQAESTALIGMFLLSLMPIVLVVVDTTIERGGALEYLGVKIDFSQAQRIEMPGLTLLANIGVPGEMVSGSGTDAILDTLRKATTSESVIVDLEEGQAWWETRLLLLLAGAVRHNQPKIVVFVGTDGGVKKCFQGWAFANELLPHLLPAHPMYAFIYHSVLAAVREWETVESRGHEDGPIRLPDWTESALAYRYRFEARVSDLPNPFFAEQMLAQELSELVEREEPPRTISLFRLEELFRPVLHKEHIDESWSSKQQLDAFFDRDTSYVAFTQNGQFKSIISRISVLNMMVGMLVQKKDKGN